MKRGWKLDPQWVAYYEKRDADRAHRQLERMKVEHEINILNARADASLRALREHIHMDAKFL